MKITLLIFFKSFCLLLALVASSTLKATTYYFSSSSGSDTYSVSAAQNPATPWKSLAKLNSIFNTLQPGDSILFKRGDVFEGAITATASGTSSDPIVFAAYGSGEKPVISGLSSFTGWTHNGSGVWEADASRAGNEMNIVLVNGSFQPIGRFPNASAANAGYLTVESYNGNTSVSSSALANSKNWTGGEIVIRKNRWILDRNLITGHNSNTVYYNSGSGYHATAGYGYFIQNHPGTLDQNGEWYFQNRKLGVFFSGSNFGLSVQGSVVPVLVTVSGQGNLSFSGLSFIGANNKAFDIRNAPNVSIVGCSILYSGINACTVSGGNGFKLEGSTIDYTNNLTLDINSSNAVIRNNTIKRSGSIAGMGKSGDGTYSAILIGGTGNLVEGNSIEQTGYVPVSFNGSSVTIKNNFINGFTQVKDDGGGIYTWNNSSNAPTYTDRKVISNIVLNGRSASEGTKEGDKKFSHGIYLDDNATNVEVSGNSVANCEGYGLYVHNARLNKVTGNTFYNNTVQIAMVRDDIAPNSPINSTEVQGNTFFSLKPSQVVAEYKSNADDIAGFGNFDQNYYCRPFDDNAVIGVLKKVGGNYSYQLTDLEGWQKMYGKDLASKKSPITFLPYAVSGFNSSNKFVNGSFTANIGGLYAFSPANNCKTSWSGSGLDGGSLAVSFSSFTPTSKGTVVMGIGAVTAGRRYLLRFSLRGGNEQKMLDVYLRKSGSPYNDISQRQLVKVSGTRKEVEILFTASESTTDGSIGIDVPEQSTVVYLDNIDLKEVLAKDVNPESAIKFVYNAAPSASSQSLGAKYMDVQSKIFEGSISLAPHTSAVLLLAGNTIVNPPPQQTACSATGSILLEQWLNIAGNDVNSIPLHQAPHLSAQLSAFEIAQDKADNYASRIRGYICPPQTGAYTFWIAGDDGVELWLSNSDNPAEKKQIAYSLGWTYFREWNKYPTQKSAVVNLIAGKKYYIEALHKEGGGGDNLSVAWQLPDGSMEAPVAGARLSPFQQSTLVAQTITFGPLTQFTLGSAPLALTASASSGLPVSFTLMSGPATLNGNVLTPTSAGTVVIRASQAGNGQYGAAPDVVQSLTVMATSQSSCSAAGNILREQWSGVSGNDVAQVPLLTLPTATSLLSSFELPQNTGDRYASRIRGYLCPPQSGHYTFWIAGDDATELWLSSGESPANKTRIAYSLQWTYFRDWNRFGSQKSASVYLEAGKKYYIEALHKEGAGGDHLSVAWRLPNGTMEAPIAGSRLSPYQSAGSGVVMSQQLNDRNLQLVLPAEKEETVTIEAFPNPFSGSATIGVTAVQTGQASVNLQDASGRTVLQLYSGLMQGGVKQRFSLQATGLNPGVYFIRFVSGNDSANYKIVLIR